MKHLRFILLTCISLAYGLVMAQTPFDSFSPETSRPMLVVEDEVSMRQQHRETLPDSMRYAVIVDIQQQAVYLADLSEESILAIAPLTEEMRNWLSVDPLSDKYPSISPYAYCAWNPIICIDPTGCVVEGSDWGDVVMFKQDVQRVLSDKKFKNFNSLLKIKGNRFQSISEKNVQTALAGIELSGDERTYIDILVSAINDNNHSYIVEYVGDEISNIGIDIIRSCSSELSNLQQEKSYLILTSFGGGISMPYGENQSYSLVDMYQSPQNRAILSQHEVLGHGIPIAYGIKGDENNSNAIRMENLVRRIMNIPETQGAGHQGKVSYPSALPKTKY